MKFYILIADLTLIILLHYLKIREDINHHDHHI